MSNFSATGLFIVILLSIGCSDPNIAKDVLAPELGRTTGPSPSAKIFPHPEGFNDPKLHGYALTTKKSELSDCLSCHGDDGNGGWSGISCLKCHSTYPHIQGWKDPEQHGRVVIETKGVKADCEKCHGQGGRGGEHIAGCIRCHATYPHGENWKKPQGHGIYVVTNGNEQCASKCHGNDFSNENGKKSCKSCHSIYPHQENFNEGEVHGAVVRGLTSVDRCTSPCHEAELSKNLPGMPSCTKCHRDYPHIDGWADPTVHGMASLIQKAGDVGCGECHSTTKVSGEEGDCKSCHPAYPHEEEWGDPAVHGSYVLDHGGAQICSGTCHGQDFDDRTMKKSCLECHPVYPHSNDWLSGAVHGVLIRTEQSPEECGGSCHGLDYDQIHPYGRNCAYCHPDYPHEQGWEIGPNPAHAQAYRGAGDNEQCTLCHIENDEPERMGDCRLCHSVYPHTADWSERTEHGGYVETNGVSACTTSCHGQDLKRDEQDGRACTGCHPSYPHAVDWQQATVHGAYAEATGLDTCASACHAYSPTLNKCNDCHEDFPHGPDWTTKGAPGWHGSVVLTKGVDVCAGECHGQDFSNTTNKKSCAECHPDFPHLGKFVATHPNRTADQRTHCRDCHENRRHFIDECLYCHE